MASSHASATPIVDEDDDLIVVTDADGVAHTCRRLLTIEVEGDRYAAVTPADAFDKDDDEPMELFIYRYKEDEDGNESFHLEMSDDEFAKVQTEAKAMMAALEDDDMLVIPDSQGTDRRYSIRLTVEVKGETYLVLASPDATPGTDFTILRHEEDEDGFDDYSSEIDEATLAEVRAEAKATFADIAAAVSSDN